MSRAALAAIVCLAGCSSRPAPSPPLPADPAEVVAAKEAVGFRTDGPDAKALSPADVAALYRTLREDASRQDAARTSYPDIPWEAAFAVTFETRDGRATLIYFDWNLGFWAPPGPRNGINYEVSDAARAILLRYIQPPAE